MKVSPHVAKTRIAKTAVAVLLGRVLMAIRQIMLVPVFLKMWGADYYGHWILISSIPAFLSVSNLGIGTGASIRIAQLVASGSHKDAWITLRTSLVMLTVVAGVLLAGICVAIYWFPQAFIRDPFNGHLILFLLLAGLIPRMMIAPLGGWWVGTKMPAVANSFSNILAFAELILSAVVIFSGGKALSLSLTIAILNVTWALVYLSRTLRLAERNSKDKLLGPIRLSEIGELLRNGVGHQLGPLWQAILFQGSLWLANHSLGPSGAAAWGSLRILFRCGNQLLELISQTLGPEFQIAIGLSDNEKIKKLHSVGLVLSIGLALLMALGLTTFGQWLFTAWTVGLLDVNGAVFIVLGFGLLSFSVWWIGGEYLRSVNEPWFLNLAAVGASVLALLLTYLLQDHHLLSLALGFSFFDLLMALVILPYVNRKMGDSLRDSLLRGLYYFRDVLYKIVRNGSKMRVVWLKNI